MLQFLMRERYYGRQKFDIKVTTDSVEARCNLPFGPKRNCILFSSLLLGCAVWGIYRAWLSSDSHGHNNWWYLAHYNTVSDFNSVVIATVIYVLFLMLGIRLLCPAGAILVCNRNQVTTIRIPWYCFTGRWVIRAYNTSDVSGFRLKFYGSGRSGNVYGIRFLVNGEKKSIFRGSIEPPEAYRILLGLKSLGLDVGSDPKLLSRVKLELLNRKEEELNRRMRI
jgi:hypothetical protein